MAPDGVQESYSTPIGGVEHAINVRGQDRDNPMVLFVHGGPAAPVIPSQWQFQRPLEEYFTIVNYDQRGAGKTYRSDDAETIADTIRIERYVDDAIEIAEHLRARYGKRKLVLMAHSWGTVVGMHAALRRPDLFHAYVGIGQVINTRENERLSYAFGLPNEGNMFTLGRLLPEFLTVDFTGVKSFPIPVVMLMGRHDYTTPSEPTAAWIEQVQAPYKQGIWFERSAHMIPWEEPGKTLVSLLEHVRSRVTGE